MLEEQYLHSIRNYCSDFLESEIDKPLYKILPHQEQFKKIKIRHRDNLPYDICDCFNNAFRDKGVDIFNRSVWVNDTTLKLNTKYVFPVNGFKFMYCLNLKNAIEHFNTLHKQYSTDVDSSALSDLLKMSFIHDDLQRGIETDNQIIIYNIPFYYTVCSSVCDYKQLLQILRK